MVNFQLQVSDLEANSLSWHAEYSLNPNASPPTWLAASVTAVDGSTTLMASPTATSYAMVWNAIGDADQQVPGGLTSSNISSSLDDSSTIHVVTGENTVALRLTVNDTRLS